MEFFVIEAIRIIEASIVCTLKFPSSGSSSRGASPKKKRAHFFLLLVTKSRYFSTQVSPFRPANLRTGRSIRSWKTNRTEKSSSNPATAAQKIHHADSLNVATARITRQYSEMNAVQTRAPKTLNLPNNVTNQTDCSTIQAAPEPHAGNSVPRKKFSFATDLTTNPKRALKEMNSVSTHFTSKDTSYEH